MKKVIIIFISSFFLFSCKNQQNKDSFENTIEKSISEARWSLYMKPEILRSVEEKALFSKFEEMFWRGVALQDEGYALQFKMTVSREEWMKNGLPEIYYDLILHDIICSNKGLLDTIVFQKQQVLKAYNETKAEKLSQWK